MNDTDAVTWLEDVLSEAMPGLHSETVARLADTLLPVVREIADQRAAEIVQTAADGSRPHDRVIAEWLDRRAAALRGEAGALDGPDTTP